MAKLQNSDMGNKAEINAKQQSSVPWKGRELRHFWALVRTNRLTADDVAAMTAQRSKTSIKDLTRSEWCEIVWSLERRNDPEYGCSDEQWARIKWLQHEIGWSDRHLENYIKKYGHIDHIRWLSSDIARKIMFAMEKVADYIPKVERETKGPDDETTKDRQ